MLVVNLNLARRMLKPNECSVEILYLPQARARQYHQNRIYLLEDQQQQQKSLNMLF